MVRMVMATVMAVILVVVLVIKKCTRRRMATMRMRRTSTMLLTTMWTRTSH